MLRQWNMRWAYRILQSVQALIFYQFFLWANLVFLNIGFSEDGVFYDMQFSNFSYGGAWTLFAMIHHFYNDVNIISYLRDHDYFGVALNERTVRKIEMIFLKSVPKYNWMFIIPYLLVYLNSYIDHLLRFYVMVTALIEKRKLQFMVLSLLPLYTVLGIWAVEVTSRCMVPVLRYGFHEYCGVPKVRRVIIVTPGSRVILHLNIDDGRIFGERLDVCGNELILNEMHFQVISNIMTEIKSSGGDGWWVGN